jgi:hypothetical protein
MGSFAVKPNKITIREMIRRRKEELKHLELRPHDG